MLSAKSANVVLSDTALGMSLMNKTNKAGPNRDPCGIPDVTGNQFECLPSITTQLSFVQIAGKPTKKRTLDAVLIQLTYQE